jgi:hypothetical protein
VISVKRLTNLRSIIALLTYEKYKHSFVKIKFKSSLNYLKLGFKFRAIQIKSRFKAFLPLIIILLTKESNAKY